MNFLCKRGYHLRLDLIEEHYSRVGRLGHQRTKIERCTCCALTITTRDTHSVTETFQEEGEQWLTTQCEP